MTPEIKITSNIKFTEQLYLKYLFTSGKLAKQIQY